MHWLANPDFWASFVTLSLLKIVLGIDNVIFISLVAAKLDKEQRFKARMLGLSGAFVMRVAFLASVVWLTQAQAPLFSLAGHAFSVRDLVLLTGGLFLLYKGTVEIHETVEGAGPGQPALKPMRFTMAVIQIMMLDLVFSIDSVITAVGLTQKIPVMIAAIVVAIITMMVASEALGRFIEKHPTTKMLALAFLLLVGVALVADGTGFHIDRTYLYFAIGFSVLVEALNITVKRRREAQHTDKAAS